MTETIETMRQYEGAMQRLYTKLAQEGGGNFAVDIIIDIQQMFIDAMRSDQAERFRLLARHYMNALCEVVTRENLADAHQTACEALGSNPHIVVSDIMERAGQVAARVLSGWTVRPGADPQKIVDIATRQIAEALETERHIAAAAHVAVTLDRKLGLDGAAFDPPGPHRAYTYQHQPNNGPAYRLGCAVASAKHERSGDAIDAGLLLLKALQARGFGVFEIEPLAAENAAATEANHAD